MIDEFSILQQDGLSIDLLESLSYRSNLNYSLKRTLRHFDRNALITEIEDVINWYDANDALSKIKIDYRIKSISSAILKYNRYQNNRQVNKVFNDILGFRTLCDDYEPILSLAKHEHIYTVDMSKGKANDDGYRGVHVYFQLSNYHYPIEIQYNTYYDRQLNDWLHKYLYKKAYDNKYGILIRNKYECGFIKNEASFREVLENVLSGSKEF